MYHNLFCQFLLGLGVYWFTYFLISTEWHWTASYLYLCSFVQIFSWDKFSKMILLDQSRWILNILKHIAMLPSRKIVPMYNHNNVENSHFPIISHCLTFDNLIGKNNNFVVISLITFCLLIRCVWTSFHIILKQSYNFVNLSFPKLVCEHFL